MDGKSLLILARPSTHCLGGKASSQFTAMHPHMNSDFMPSFIKGIPDLSPFWFLQSCTVGFIFTSV